MQKTLAEAESENAKEKGEQNESALLHLTEFLIISISGCEPKKV